jgi:hypothetical protein
MAKIVIFFFKQAGAELQWCKLVFFWEWYGFEPTAPNAHINAGWFRSSVGLLTR